MLSPGATKTHPAPWVRDEVSPIDSTTSGHQNVPDTVPPPRSAHSKSHGTSTRHPTRAGSIAGSAKFCALETRRARGRGWMSAASFRSSPTLERCAASSPTRCSDIAFSAGSLRRHCAGTNASHVSLNFSVLIALYASTRCCVRSKVFSGRVRVELEYEEGASEPSPMPET